jgi:hypothetical protein
MYEYEVDDNGYIEKVEAESFEEAAEVWMAVFAPDDSEAKIVFVTDAITGVRRKVDVYVEKSVTYYARSLNLVLIRGLPGSGKSTMAKKFGYEHFEADQYFENGDWRDLHYAHSQCLTKTSQCLVDGKSCVVSNTFTTFEEIEPYLQAADAAGARVYIGECKDAPPKVIENMRKRWEPLESILGKSSKIFIIEENVNES